MTTWHLYFPPRRFLIAHVCDWHREAGQRLECSDAAPDGTCPHVLTRPCDCRYEPPCGACIEDGLLDRRN